MRKTTISMIVGILIGMVITNISHKVSIPMTSEVALPPVATKVATKSVSVPFEHGIAPGLQIIEVPPPLDLMGNHPYQCYMNGKPINIPSDLVKQLVAEHGNPTDNDPDFNIHDFTGNLKMNNQPTTIQSKQTTLLSVPGN